MDDMERANLLLDIIVKASNAGPPYSPLAYEASEELKHIVEGCKQMQADRDTESKRLATEAYERQLSTDVANNAANETEVLAVEELPPPTEIERRV